ncbi:MAG: hypothetical protein U0V74_07435 [Chitinophagales bacterium]
MASYRAQFNQNGKLIVTLIGPPLLIIPFIAGLAKYFRNLPDNAVLAIIFIFMIALIGSVLYLVKLNLNTVTVTIEQEKLSVVFEKRSRFTPADFTMPLSQLNNCYLGANRAGIYLSIAAKAEPHSFNLGAASQQQKDVDDFSALAGELLTAVNSYNEQHDNAIQSTNPSGPLFLQVLFFMVVIVGAFAAVAYFFL